MLGKLQRNLERKKDGKLPVKFRFDVQVVELKGIPESIEICRVVWSRGAKVLMTDISQVDKGVAQFGGKLLSQVATVYRGTGNSMESKEYAFKIQVPKNDKNLTLGKGIIDLGLHASTESEPKDVIVPVKFSAGSKELGNGELQLILSCSLMKGFSSEDGMTVMSGLSGLSSPFDNDSEQDLSGFDKIHRVSSADAPPLPPRLSKKSSELERTGEGMVQPTETPHTPNGSDEAPIPPSRRSLDAIQKLKQPDPSADNIAMLEERIRNLEDKVSSQKREKAEVELQLKESIARAQASLESSQRALEGERAEKLELETQLSKQLEGGEHVVDDAVRKAVAVWELRYNKIQQDYERARQRADEELDELNQHLLSSRQEAMGFEHSLQATTRAKENMEREKLALETTLMETSSDRMDLEKIRNQLEVELKEVRAQLQKAGTLDDDDGERVMTELIEAKVNLAELHESFTVTRHELYKSRETNMLLASKMTKLETYLYNKREVDNSEHELPEDKSKDADHEANANSAED